MKPILIDKTAKPEPTPADPIVQVLREQIVVKEQQLAYPLKGWRFVPYRDADNLILEIIATPIE